MKKSLFVSRNLIGDGLYIGPSLVRWHELNPEFEIDLLTLDDHVKCIYDHFGIPVNVVTSVPPEFQYDFQHTFNVNEAFDYSDRRFRETGKPEGCHLAEAYAALLGVDLVIDPAHPKAHIGPIFIPTEEEIVEEMEDLVLISMFSASCTSRDKTRPGLPPNKMLPWPKWELIIRYLRDHFGDENLRFLGAPTDRAPELSVSEDQYLTGVPLNRLALYMKHSKCVITLDNGMAHLSASQKVREFVFYPVCLGTHYIMPIGNPRCMVLQMDPVRLSVGNHVIPALKQFTSICKI